MNIGRLGMAGLAGSALWLLLAAAPASAVVCDITYDDYERTMTLTPLAGTATCEYSGATPPSEGNFHGDLGFNEIEKLDGVGSGTWVSTTGMGTTSGMLTLDGQLYNTFANVHVVFKYGSGSTEPDWFSYSLLDVFTAAWSVNQQQALSHLTLYGDRDTTTVPAPGVLALLGTGLLGLFAAVRRRRI